jgi:branched-chain amino acid aminotransferase
VELCYCENMKYVWLNGALQEMTQARISPVDHGLVTGDGLFETLVAYGGKVFALTRHIERLKRSARGMFMPTDVIEKTNWKKAVDDLIRANRLNDARVRITYTTGEADLGSDRGTSSPNILIAAGDFPKMSAEGSLSVVPWPRCERAALAGLKTTSYGENVKALYYAKKNGCNEALFLNLKGHVCEGTGTNVGWIKNGKLFTPTLESGCLAGITRDLLLELARKEGFDFQEVNAPLTELLSADEVFLMSTLREAQWVSRVDDKSWDTSSNKITQKLKKLFVDYSRKNLDP